MSDPTPALTDEQRAEVVTAVLRKVVNVTNLPEWMQVPALGKSMRPLAELVADALAPLIARMVTEAEQRALREAADDARLAPADSTKLAAWLRARADEVTP